VVPLGAVGSQSTELWTLGQREIQARGWGPVLGVHWDGGVVGSRGSEENVPKWKRGGFRSPLSRRGGFLGKGSIYSPPEGKTQFQGHGVVQKTWVLPNRKGGGPRGKNHWVKKVQNHRGNNGEPRVPSKRAEFEERRSPPEGWGERQEWGGTGGLKRDRCHSEERGGKGLSPP